MGPDFTKIGPIVNNDFKNDGILPKDFNFKTLIQVVSSITWVIKFLVLNGIIPSTSPKCKIHGCHGL